MGETRAKRNLNLNHEQTRTDTKIKKNKSTRFLDFQISCLFVFIRGYFSIGAFADCQAVQPPVIEKTLV